MTWALDRKTLLKVALILGLAVLVAGFVAVSVGQVLARMNRLPVQLDKVVAAALLHDRLVQESYAVRGYMLYGSADYLAAFRERNAANRREIEELLEVVRPARKPLVQEILNKHRRYTEICESKIIPLVAAGDTAGAAKAARETGAVQLIQEMLDLTSRLQEMRLADTRALLAGTQERTVQALVFGCGFGVAVLAAVFGASSLAMGRTALENTTYRLVLRRAHSGIVVVQRDGRVHFINRAAVSLLGLDREKAIGRPWSAVAGDRLRVVNGGGETTPPLARVLAGGEDLCDLELAYTAPDGRRLFFLADCAALRSEEGRTLGAVLLFRDITARREEEERLRQMSVRDSLTLLFNHAYMKEALEREVQASLAHGRKLGFLLLDVDDFKTYNDQFGHPMGDKVLKELARVLQENVRWGDLVARYGGDEFAVILPGAGEETAREVAERLRQAVAAHPFPYR
ncbi:MAG: diguanylate cyclase, partial [Bacillota bacterium]